MHNGIQAYAKLQSFVQLFLKLTKLCHIMRVHPPQKKKLNFHLKALCTNLIVKYKRPPNSPNFNHLTTNTGRNAADSLQT